MTEEYVCPECGSTKFRVRSGLGQWAKRSHRLIDIEKKTNTFLRYEDMEGDDIFCAVCGINLNNEFPDTLRFHEMHDWIEEELDNE